ncbi:hypothetical protein E2P81_ATG01630 [Venturia nashicola]|nr:hypothetical protein E2P81_ATG01630 [Venturia nashicola]
MNQGYYRPPTTSRASATTKCQKCLKLDMFSPAHIKNIKIHEANFLSRHYSYECKAKPDERPYQARPSRTAQLKNPKLAPKLNSDVPNDLLRKKGTADEILASKAVERGRKRSRSVESQKGKSRRGASRSMSTSSVSTISTAASRSASAPARRRRPLGGKEADGDSYMTSQSFHEAPRKRPRRSVSTSTNSSFASHHSDRNTRRRRKSKSPAARGRRRSRSSRRDARSRSRSVMQHTARRSFEGRPHAARDEPRRQDEPLNRNSNMMRNGNMNENGGGGGGGFGSTSRPAPPRERSMSPYSKRLALTQSMNQR